MSVARWVGGALWIGSWFVMYREITRWHHVKPTLAFNYDIGPDAHPGLPLILVYITSVAAPLVVVAGSVIQIQARRAAQ